MTDLQCFHHLIIVASKSQSRVQLFHHRQTSSSVQIQMSSESIVLKVPTCSSNTYGELLDFHEMILFYKTNGVFNMVKSDLQSLGLL